MGKKLEIVPVKGSGSDGSILTALKVLADFRKTRPAPPPLPSKKGK